MYPTYSPRPWRPRPREQPKAQRRRQWPSRCRRLYPQALRMAAGCTAAAVARDAGGAAPDAGGAAPTPHGRPQDPWRRRPSR